MKMISRRFVFFIACVFLTGCGRAPAVDIIGSFLPAWMVCLTAGIILAFIVRTILVRYQCLGIL